MKLESCSCVDINAMVGASISNPQGKDFLVTGISLSLDDLTPWIHIKNPEHPDSECAIPFDDSLKDWSIQLGNSLFG